jgi:hypothetical protein
LFEFACDDEVFRAGDRPYFRRGLILTLAHLLDGNPLLPLGRNIKFFGRYLYGFLCIGGLDGPKVFRTLADYIETLAGHGSHDARANCHGTASNIECRWKCSLRM